MVTGVQTCALPIYLPLDYFTSGDVDLLTAAIKKLPPALLIVDSIQTLKTQDLLGQAGGLGQIKECVERVVQTVKSLHIPTFLIGHVTKDGGLAGPKVLEHLVDAIFALEGERSGELRFLRVLKNRFGASDEVGVFKMNELGMSEVANPSEYFLQESQTGVPDSRQPSRTRSPRKWPRARSPCRPARSPGRWCDSHR